MQAYSMDEMRYTFQRILSSNDSVTAFSFSSVILANFFNQ